MTDWRVRAGRLVDELTEAGVLSSPRWRRAVAEVPRHLLVPAYYVYTTQGWRAADTTSPDGRQRWLELVYANKALFVLPGGLSSTSMPGLMTRMLEALDVRDGQRVLEIGTGSGYNAALLCHRLGDQQVFSVDLEAELVDLARDRLAAIGYRPTLVARDGIGGLPEHAPYDRVIATCSVPAIPWGWVQQTGVDGLLLADLKLGGTAGNLVLLRRLGDRAEGRFDDRFGSFMPMRHVHGPPRPAPMRRDRGGATERGTCLDLPRPWEQRVFWFFAHLDAELDFSGHGQVFDPETGQPGDAFLASPDGSWCEIGATVDHDRTRRVWQGGPRRLWDEIEVAYQHWSELGRPGWDRFGLTVTEDGGVVWLDAPGPAAAWAAAIRDSDVSTPERS
jgi:protein-L-isoaspartate O-methyltransferase